MKNFKTIVLGMLLAMLSTSFIFAGNEVNIKVNGQMISSDVAPYIKGNRTYVSARFVSEALGYDVGWNGDTREVSISNAAKSILLKIGDKNFKVGNINKVMDAAPEITDSRTMVPVRFVAENLGAKVDWDGVTRTVLITTAGMPKSEVKDYTELENISNAEIFKPEYAKVADQYGMAAKIANLDDFPIKLSNITVYSIEKTNDKIIVNMDSSSIHGTIHLLTADGNNRIRASVSKTSRFEFDLIDTADLRAYGGDFDSKYYSMSDIKYIGIQGDEGLLIIENPFK